jgi:hypothetical protein
MLASEFQTFFVTGLVLASLLAAIGLGAFCWGFIESRIARSRALRARAEDMKVPERAWCHVILSFVNELDIGFMPKSSLKPLLKRSYGIDNARKLEDVGALLEAKFEAGSTMAAIDLATLLRAGAACQYVSQQASWDQLTVLCRRLSRRFRSWSELVDRLSAEYAAAKPSGASTLRFVFRERRALVIAANFLNVPYESI